jgi:hypothetical protein
MHTNYLPVFLKNTYWEYILEKISSTSKVEPIFAVMAPTPVLLRFIYRYYLIYLNNEGNKYVH